MSRLEHDPAASRRPPAAAWWVGPDPWGQGSSGVLWGGAAAAATAALCQRAELPCSLVALLAALAAAAAATVAWRGARQTSGQLAWTGVAWTWSPDAGGSQVLLAPDVMLDLDGWMLLRFAGRDGEPRRWWRVRRDARQDAAGDAGWSAFRAAVYSPASRTDDRPDARGGSSP